MLSTSAGRSRSLVRRLAWCLAPAGLSVLLFAALGLEAPPAVADGGPIFPVMNTSETPPDGVYFRSSPHTADAVRITGFGVFAGESIQANCWSWGDPVGSFNNHIWYNAANVTRTTVNGRANAGWINTHYVADNMNADHAAPGVPQCGSNPAPPPTAAPPPPTSAPTPTSKSQTPAPVVNIPNAAPTQRTPPGSNLQGGNGSTVQNQTTQPVQGTGLPGKPASTPAPGPTIAYFSPFPSRQFELTNAPNVRTSHVDQWKSGNFFSDAYNSTLTKVGAPPICDDSKAINSLGNLQSPKTLLGWSAGRLGVIYYLKHASDAQRENVQTIVLVDPGSYNELYHGCDWAVGAGDLFASWLAQDPSHHLVVLSGPVTADTGNPQGGKYHGGIQVVYFNPIRNLAAAEHVNLSSQVIVCGYQWSHERMFLNSMGFLNSPSFSCPVLGGQNSSTPWHP